MTRNVRALKTEGVVTYQPMYDEATGSIRVERSARPTAGSAITASTPRARSALPWPCSRRAVNSTRQSGGRPAGGGLPQGHHDA